MLNSEIGHRRTGASRSGRAGSPRRFSGACKASASQPTRFRGSLSTSVASILAKRRRHVALSGEPRECFGSTALRSAPTRCDCSCGKHARAGCIIGSRGAANRSGGAT
eukprot:g32634.t1